MASMRAESREQARLTPCVPRCKRVYTLAQNLHDIEMPMALSNAPNSWPRKRDREREREEPLLITCGGVKRVGNVLRYRFLIIN